MKILFITRKWPPAMGGMETYCVRLVSRLSDRHALTPITLPGKSNGDAPNAAAMVWFGLRTIVRLIARPGGFDVIHGGDMAVWPLVLVAKFRSRSAKLVLSAHGSDVAFAGRDGVRPSLYRLYMRAGAMSLRGARVVANSEATAALAQGLGFRRTDVVPLGADFAADSPAPNLTRSILFAGRLVGRKGLSWFVDEVLPKLPAEITLEVAGTVWDDREQMALSAPRVRFLGRLNEDALRAKMAGALCVIVPNIQGAKGEFEGFGLVAPEAAVAGGIVLAARIHGLTSAVIDGETGRLLTSQSAFEWVDAIGDVAKLSPEERARMVAKFRANARSHFNWDRVAEATEAIYLEEHETK